MNKRIFFIVSSLLLGFSTYNAVEFNRHWESEKPRGPPPEVYEQIKNWKIDIEIKPNIDSNIKYYRDKILEKEKEIIDDMISRNKKELYRDRKDLIRMEGELEELIQYSKEEKDS